MHLTPCSFFLIMTLYIERNLVPRLSREGLNYLVRNDPGKLSEKLQHLWGIGECCKLPRRGLGGKVAKDVGQNAIQMQGNSV